MKKTSALFFLFIFVTALSRSTALRAGNGTTAALFLLENPSARQVAMGGVHTVNADAADAIHSNPAGLSLLKRPEIGLSYASQQDTGKHGFAGYAHPFLKRDKFTLTAGVGMIYYSAGNIDVHFSNGTPSKSIIAEYAYAGTLALGARIGRWISLGIAPKYMSSTIVEQYSAKAALFDGGFMVFPFPDAGERIVIGGTFQNYGSKLSYKSADHNAPQTTALGIGGKLFRHREYGSFSASAQMENSLGEPTRYRIGSEYSFGARESSWEAFIRGGYRFQLESENYSFGVGIREKNMELNYALVNAPSLERTHRLTLSFRFGKYVGPEEKIERLESDSDELIRRSSHQILSEEKEKRNSDAYKLLEAEENKKKSKPLLKDESRKENYRLYQEEKGETDYQLLKEKGED